MPDESAPRHTTARPRAGGAELGVASGRYDNAGLNDEQRDAMRRHGFGGNGADSGRGGHLLGDPGRPVGLWTDVGGGGGRVEQRAWAMGISGPEHGQID